jgi:hypothetical protein
MGGGRTILPYLWGVLPIVDERRLSSGFLLPASKLLSFDLDVCDSLIARFSICLASLLMASIRLFKHPSRLVPGPKGDTRSESFL